MPSPCKSRPTTARSITAKVIGTDPKTDLALIKVDGKTDFPFVKFADQSPQSATG